jgi:hypothetical protein
LAKSGYDSIFYANIQAISAHETAHVRLLTAAIQAAGFLPMVGCIYTFGITSIEAFVATANRFEGIGTSVYLGVAAQVANKQVLTAAVSILAVEVRRSSDLRASLKGRPFLQPNNDPLTRTRFTQWRMAYRLLSIRQSDIPGQSVPRPEYDNDRHHLYGVDYCCLDQ